MPFREERPERRLPFTHSFPDDPALDALVTKFVAGDFAGVREGAGAIGGSDASPEVKAAAAELLRRTAPDGLVKLLLLVASMLLVGLTLYWEIESRGHVVLTK